MRTKERDWDLARFRQSGFAQFKEAIGRIWMVLGNQVAERKFSRMLWVLRTNIAGSF